MAFGTTLDSAAQYFSLVAIAVISSFLSIVGSLFILRFIRKNYKESCRANRSRGRRSASANAFSPTYLRIMFGMSCFDLLYSINLVLQPVLVPRGEWYPYAHGNETSCTVTGAFHQMGFGGWIYYAMLSFYYLLTVRMGKSQEWMAKRAEPVMHTVAIGFPLITAITGLVIDCFSYLDLYVGCWVANYPRGCNYGWTDFYCSDIPGYLFGGLPSFLLIPALIINNALVFLHVRKTYLNASSSVAFSASTNNMTTTMDDRQRKRLQQVAMQATLYVIAAFLTYLPLIINELVLNVILGYTSGDQGDLFGWMVVVQILIGLGGFWNAIIFFRPQYLVLRIRKKSRWQAINTVLGFNKQGHGAPAIAKMNDHKNNDTSSRRWGIDFSSRPWGRGGDGSSRLWGFADGGSSRGFGLADRGSSRGFGLADRDSPRRASFNVPNNADDSSRGFTLADATPRRHSSVQFNLANVPPALDEGDEQLQAPAIPQQKEESKEELSTPGEREYPDVGTGFELEDENLAENDVTHEPPTTSSDTRPSATSSETRPCSMTSETLEEEKSSTEDGTSATTPTTTPWQPAESSRAWSSVFSEETILA